MWSRQALRRQDLRMHDEGRENKTRLKINKSVTETTQQEEFDFKKDNGYKTKTSLSSRQPSDEKAVRCATRRGQGTACNEGQGQSTDGRDPFPVGGRATPSPGLPPSGHHRRPAAGARPLLSAAGACAGPGQLRRRPRSPHSGAAGSCRSRWCRRSSLR